MPDLPQSTPFRYAVLAVFALGALAFQAPISIGALQHLWSQAQHFEPRLLAPWGIELNLHILTPLSCLLLGLYVVGMRVWDRKAWLLLAVLVSFSLIADGSNIHDEVMQWHTPLRHLALVYRSTFVSAWPLFMLLFAIYFPERARFDRDRSWLKWIVLVPASAVYLVMVFERILRNEGAEPADLVQPMRDITHNLAISSIVSLLTLSLVILVVKLATARDPDDNRRLRILFSGLAVSFVPAITYNIFFRRLLQARGQMLPEWASLIIYSLLLLFPFTLAYVTVVERALDVRVLVRQGLQYAVARRGVAVLQLIVSLVVVLLVALLSGHLVFGARVLITAAGIAMVFLVGVAAAHLSRWVDRRFFREAHHTEQLLVRLADTAGTLVELPELLNTVSSRIAEVLHVSKIAVFLCESNRYGLAFALGYETPPDVAFTDDSFALAQLRQIRHALPVLPEDPRSWVRSDRRTLVELGKLETELLLPLASNDQLLGFLSLGCRLAEAPYSSRDVALLETVAEQTALAIENSRLTAAIATETAEREVLQRELAIARDVQQRLLPQSFPKFEELDCFAACRPAREVGGDYFDFLELPNRVLGIAIGDVAGKGIPASLLMASLQASLRSQTLSDHSRLENVVANINQLVYGASPVNRYATFFYAQYEPLLKRLTFVNAGHNPPMLFRTNGVQMGMTRLETGGPPVGILPHSPYESGSVELGPGDLLILFTDGVPEAMNVSEEEWGEDRLIRAIRKIGVKRSEEIAQAVFRYADEFAGEAPQHDDMTLVVMAFNA